MTVPGCVTQKALLAVAVPNCMRGAGGSTSAAASPASALGRRSESFDNGGWELKTLPLAEPLKDCGSGICLRYTR